MEIYDTSNLPNVYSISIVKRQRILSLISAKVQLEELKQNFFYYNKERDNSMYMVDFPRKLDNSLTTSSLIFKECNKSPIFCCFIDDTKYWIYSAHNTARIFSYHIRSTLIKYFCGHCNPSIIGYAYNCLSVKKKIPISINLAAKKARSLGSILR